MTEKRSSKVPPEPAVTLPGKIQKVGATPYIKVPREWMENQGLDFGDDVIIVANSVLTIMAKTDANVKKTHELAEQMLEK